MLKNSSKMSNKIFSSSHWTKKSNKSSQFSTLTMNHLSKWFNRFLFLNRLVDQCVVPLLRSLYIFFLPLVHSPPPPFLSSVKIKYSSWTDLFSFLIHLIFTLMYSDSAGFISHYSKWIVVKLGGEEKAHPEAEKPWQQTVFLRGLMWGSDEYDGLPVINQTAACLSMGWPPRQTPGPPPPPGGALGGGSADTAEHPLFSFLSLSRSPSTLLLLTAITPVLQSL